MWGGRRSPFARCLLPAPLCLLCGCLGQSAVVPDYRFREAHIAELQDHLYSGAFAATTRHRQDAETAESPPHLTTYRPGTSAAPAGRLTLTAVPAGDHAEALRVLVQPRDPAGRPDRGAAALQLSVLQEAPGGQSTCLGRWELPPDLLEHTWTASWEGTGYRLVLPWTTWPTAERIRVVARLTYGDGVSADAEREVTLRPAAGDREVSPTTERSAEIHQAQATVVVPPSGEAGEARWEPAPLQGAIKVGLPVPLGPED